ncbi:serine/threonine protein kinase [Frankia sp. AgB1.9]|uniref:serine/threonine protein kinase n=1 Tax=Frankia sp. AgB1.9 TaxID=1836968 RepID=UPI0027DE5228|nr:serine/threonine protein kinase [Frankia sp. AgB1.9]
MDVPSSSLPDSIHDAPTGPLPSGRDELAVPTRPAASARQAGPAVPGSAVPGPRLGPAGAPEPGGAVVPPVSAPLSDRRGPSPTGRRRAAGPAPNRRRGVLVGAAALAVLILVASILAWALHGSGTATQGGRHGSNQQAAGASQGPGGLVPKDGQGRARSAGDGPVQGAEAAGSAGAAPGSLGQAPGDTAGAAGQGATNASAGTVPGAGAGPGVVTGSGPGTVPSAGTGTGGGTGSGTAATHTAAPAPATPATAKKNPYTAAQVCGSGYSQIDSHTLTSGSTTVTIVLMYNGGTNCVATMKSGAGVGTAQSVSASVQAQNGSAKVTDSGSYQYYAGPVKVAAKAICVKWGGSLGSVSWTSGWSHCG